MVKDRAHGQRGREEYIWSRPAIGTSRNSPHSHATPTRTASALLMTISFTRGAGIAPISRRLCAVVRDCSVPPTAWGSHQIRGRQQSGLSGTDRRSAAALFYFRDQRYEKRAL